MNVELAQWLAVGYGVSEFGLALFKRAGKEASTADRGSLVLLWVVIFVSFFVAFFLAHALPQCAFGPREPVMTAGLIVFVLGIALRWCAIIVLGRFFTVDVAIASDHRLVNVGPYRWIRHPSYTGALAAFAGIGLCLCNWASLLALMIPVAAVFARRMRIEESALLAALGDRYREYMHRTKRLIPAIY